VVGDRNRAILLVQRSQQMRVPSQTFVHFMTAFEKRSIYLRRLVIEPLEHPGASEHETADAVA
jgi:hypothetical protein